MTDATERDLSDYYPDGWDGGHGHRGDPRDGTARAVFLDHDTALAAAQDAARRSQVPMVLSTEDDAALGQVWVYRPQAAWPAMGQPQAEWPWALGTLVHP